MNNPWSEYGVLIFIIGLVGAILYNISSMIGSQLFELVAKIFMIGAFGSIGCLLLIALVQGLVFWIKR